MRLWLLLALGFNAFGAGTQISDTIKTPFSGTLFTGKINISGPQMTTAAGDTIARWQNEYQVTNGVFSVTLEPNDTATPAGTSYSVRYTPTPVQRGVAWSEVWLVPTSATPLKINQVRVTTTPSPGLTILPQQIVPPLSYSATFNALAEAAGTVAVANGSSDITGIGTSWTIDMNGRQMMVDQCATAYRFTYVSATSGTFEAPYDCPTKDATPATLTGTAAEPFVITSGLNGTVQLRINGTMDVSATLTASTPASVTGSVDGPFVIATGVNDALQLRINDAVDVAVTLTAGEARAAGDVAGDIQSALAAAGAAAVAEAYGSAVRIRSTTPAGTVSSIEIQTGSANETLGLIETVATGGVGRTAEQVASDIQSALTNAGAPAVAEASGGYVVVRSTTPVGTSSSIEVKSGGTANATLGFTVGTRVGGSGATYQLNQSVRIPGTTHRLATPDISVHCFDGTTGTMIADVAAITINPTSYDVEVIFWTAHAGRCELHR